VLGRLRTRNYEHILRDKTEKLLTIVNKDLIIHIPEKSRGLRMVTMAELKKIKIDAVEEVHAIKGEVASYSSGRIRELALRAGGK